MVLPEHRADPGEEMAIRRILDDLSRAFEARDAELYARHFAEDADWENAFGGRARGRSEIQTFISRVYPLFARSAQTLLETRVRFVTPDVAVADVDREITGQVSTRGVPLPPRRVRTTHVLRREEGEWRIDVFRVADLRDASEMR